MSTMASEMVPAPSASGALPVPIVRVKQEREDDDEIMQMAAKIVETNRQKMALAAQNSAHGGNMVMARPGQPAIQSFMIRQDLLGSRTSVKKAYLSDDLEKKPPALDEESQRGRFGWTIMDKIHIPYIYRQNHVKFCAVRMVETKLLNKYLHFLRSDISSCTCIRSYYITESEAKLLNEVNVRHCECQFGREAFTVKDLVVRLEDGEEFYKFLEVCYNKLVTKTGRPGDRCGFFRINGESVVPYTVKEGVKYVPLFYFEGETDNLKLKAEKVEGWDLAYLKFCCKVQGIRNELFANETCAVVSLEDIKAHFPSGTVFEEYWPSRSFDAHLTGNNPYSSTGHWTQRPGAVNPSALVPTTGSMIYNGWSGLVGGQAGYPSPMAVIPTPGVPVPSSPSQQLQPPVGMPRVAMHPVTPQMGVQRVPPPPPLVRVSGPSTLPRPGLSTSSVAQTTPAVPASFPVSTPAVPLSFPVTTPTSVSYSNRPVMGMGNHHMRSQPHMVLNQVNAAAPSQTVQANLSSGASPKPANQVPVTKQPPPPLIPVNGTLVSPPPRISPAARSEAVDLSSWNIPNNIQPTPGLPQSPPSIDSSLGSRLVQIQDFPIGQSTAAPYKIQKALIEGRMVPCINLKPFVFNELLMTLPEFVHYFFPNLSLQSCRQVLQDVLGVFLYRGNNLQMTLLRDAGKCQSRSDVLPLVQVKDVMTYMPQMKYMCARMGSEENAAKRQRTS